MKGSSSLVVVFVILASGCAVTKDGIGPAERRPTAEKVAHVKQQLEQNEKSARDADSTSGEAATDKAQPGILVVGTTGPLRSIEDKDRAGFFAAYQKVAEQWHPGVPPGLDAAAFQARLGGWASIQTFGIPGIMSTRNGFALPSADLVMGKRSRQSRTADFSDARDPVKVDSGNSQAARWEAAIL